MDYSLLGTMVDPTKCGKLGLKEKRKFVRELAKDPHGTPETLLSWSRQEILQLLCVEMGKERKYTGLTKLKIIENLLKIVSEKNLRDSAASGSEQPVPDSSGNRTPKGQRKPDHLSPFSTPADSASGSNGSSAVQMVIQCKNSACKASLRPEDAFCKRCSCCICQKFDDNKDPSLWLTCSSEPPFESDSCNMSCHLECALKHVRSGLSKRGQVAQLDGSFYCVSCGKMNDLLKCWRKQLMIARDTRRVDILCYRVFLSQKLLNGTNKYQKLSEIVDEAVSKLQAEVGPLTDVTVKMGRGIVNRMSTGHEVQRLCASAVELLEAILSQATVDSLTHPADPDSRTSAPSTIRFEEISDMTVTVILGPANQMSELNACYTLWHRKAVEEKEPPEPTCTMSPPGTRVVVRGLAPSTEYVFKAVCSDSFQELSTYEARLSTAAPATERSQSPVTNCSTLSNPSSVEDETNITTSGLNENNRADNYYSMVPANTMNGPPPSCIGSMWPANTMNGPPSNRADNYYSILNNAAALDQSGTPMLENTHSQECLVGKANGSTKPTTTGKEIIPCPPPETGLPITPCRVEVLQTVRRSGRPKSSNKDTGNQDDQPQPRSSSKKRNRESQEEDGCDGNEDLEFYVKAIRRLECEGHIEKSFRQKLLTWYSLRATPRETHVVQVFVNTLRDDPAALAEQLIDAFEEIVSNKRSEPPIEPGFCMKLWH